MSHCVFTPEQDNDKTNVQPVHSYYAFHTRSDKPGVKGTIGMHRFNICLVVVLSLSCSGVKTPSLPREDNTLVASLPSPQVISGSPKAITIYKIT